MVIFCLVRLFASLYEKEKTLRTQERKSSFLHNGSKLTFWTIRESMLGAWISGGFSGTQMEETLESDSLVEDRQRKAATRRQVKYNTSISLLEVRWWWWSGLFAIGVFEETSQLQLYRSKVTRRRQKRKKGFTSVGESLVTVKRCAPVVFPYQKSHSAPCFLFFHLFPSERVRRFAWLYGLGKPK